MFYSKKFFSVIALKSLYFGWLLSFPFYGPVLHVAAPEHDFWGFSLPLIFTFFHAISFVGGALFLKNVLHWKRLINAGLATTLLLSLMLPFFPPAVWPWAMGILGIAGALFILGWAYPYTVLVPMAGRIKLMASVIIGANVVYIIFNMLSQLTPPFLLLFISVVPLVLALLVLVFYPPTGGEVSTPVPSAAGQKSFFPGTLVLIICLFTAGLYLCSGFMYNIMQPLLSTASPLFIYYRYVPYIAVLIIMWRFGSQLRWYFSIYMGVSLLGLSFVSFAFSYDSAAGLFVTTNLIEAAYAFLDLFLWTLLGDLAFIYGAPFQFFGFSLAAMLFSILAGELIGVQLLLIGENYPLVTALFAAAAIFLTFSVVPWLNERVNLEFQQTVKEGNAAKGDDAAKVDPLERAIQMLPPQEELTPRETEITALLLKGITNREISRQLFISENTLKTHLRHIYSKFGVAQKRELFSLVVEDKRDIPPSGK